jgi:transcriptional regulator with XRE-family HTH domain
MNIGNSIRELRKSNGMSQEDLAVKAKLTQAALSQIERGKRPGLDTTKRLAKALKVPESLLYAMAIEREEVPEENRPLYDSLFPVIQNMIKQLANNTK